MGRVLVHDDERAPRPLAEQVRPGVLPHEAQRRKVAGGPRPRPVRDRKRERRRRSVPERDERKRCAAPLRRARAARPREDVGGRLRGDERGPGLRAAVGTAPGDRPSRGPPEPRRRPERARDRVEDRVLHLARLREPNLVLLRVHVHVHAAERDAEEQDRGGVAAGGQRSGERPQDRVRRAPVAHPSPVHEQVDGAPGRLRVIGRTDDAAHPHAAALPVHRDEVSVRLAAERLDRALRERLTRPCREREPPAAPERERDVRTREREPDDRFGDVPRLGRRRAHELAARRGVVEEVAHLDGGPARPADRTDLAEHPALDVHAGPVAILARRGLEPEARHRRDRGERLTAEAHRRDRGEPRGVAELGRRVALERQGRVVAVQAAAVVRDPDEREATLLHVDRDRARARVERVLDELLHHRGGALDHLPGGDLVHEPGRQDLDARHRAFVAR